MAIQVSDDVATFLKWLTGEELPGTDEDRLRNLGQAQIAAADGLDEVVPILVSAVNSIRDGVQGASEQAFVDAMKGYLHDPGYITLAGRYVRRLGSDLEDTATQVEYTKLMIIATVIELMIELAIALAVAWFFPGVLDAVAMRLTTGQVKIALWLARLIVNVVLGQVTGIGMQVLMDLIVQAIQIRNGTREHFNADLTADAAAIGAWGGAVGVVLGAGAGPATGLLRRARGVFPGGAGADVATGIAGAGGKNAAGAGGKNSAGAGGRAIAPDEPPTLDGFVKDLGHEAVSEVVTEGTYGMMTGTGWQWGAMPATAVSGALSGAAEGSGTALGYRLRHRNDGINGPANGSDDDLVPPRSNASDSPPPSDYGPAPPSEVGGGTPSGTTGPAQTSTNTGTPAVGASDPVTAGGVGGSGGGATSGGGANPARPPLGPGHWSSPAPGIAPHPGASSGPAPGIAPHPEYRPGPGPGTANAPVSQAPSTPPGSPLAPDHTAAFPDQDMPAMPSTPQPFTSTGPPPAPTVPLDPAGPVTPTAPTPSPSVPTHTPSPSVPTHTASPSPSPSAASPSAASPSAASPSAASPSVASNAAAGPVVPRTGPTPVTSVPGTTPATPSTGQPVVTSQDRAGEPTSRGGAESGPVRRDAQVVADRPTQPEPVHNMPDGRRSDGQRLDGSRLDRPDGNRTDGQRPDTGPEQVRRVPTTQDTRVTPQDSVTLRKVASDLRREDALGQGGLFGRGDAPVSRTAHDVSASLRRLLADSRRPVWTGEPDCYPGLLASYLAKHRRLARRTVDETLLGRGDPREFAHAVDGSWEQFGGDADALRTLLTDADGTRRDGWSAYVWVRPPGGDAHMFELHADATVPAGQPGGLKWVDLQRPTGWRDATSDQGLAENLPLARVMLTDAAGRWVPLAEAAGPRNRPSGPSLVEALVDSPRNPGPGMLRRAALASRSRARDDRFTEASASTVVPKPSGSLYQDQPDLLYEVDGATDLDKLVDDLRTDVEERVRARIRSIVHRLTRGGRQAISVDFSRIESALRNDLQSFFTSGGRTFDVRDGTGRWHSVTVSTTRLTDQQQRLDQSHDKARYDTRNDFSTALKETESSGDSLAIGAGFIIGGRVGPGGGLSGEMALAQAAQTSESGATLFDSHNIRSGGVSHLVLAPVRFTVQVGKPGSALPTPPPAHQSTAEDGEAPPNVVTAQVGFRALDDIAKATPRTDDMQRGRFDVSTLVQNLNVVRILDARTVAVAQPGTFASNDGAAGALTTVEDDDSTDSQTWNEVVEDILRQFQPTGTADQGSLSREQLRALLSEPSVLGQLLPALESDVNSPLIVSPSRRQAVALQLNAEVTGMQVVADVKKSSFRWQPGYTVNGREQHISAVGGSGSVVPIRWGFGWAYVQLRLSAGFRRNTTTSARQSSTTRTGTEFKDIENVLAKVNVRLTINTATRVNAFQQPFRAGVRPIVLDLSVLSRLPKAKAEELVRDVRPPVLRRTSTLPPREHGTTSTDSVSATRAQRRTSATSPERPRAYRRTSTVSIERNTDGGERDPQQEREFRRTSTVSIDPNTVGKIRELGPEQGPGKHPPPFADKGGHAMPYQMSQFADLQQQTARLVRRFGGGFLPRFRREGVAQRMAFASSASERQRNQAALDRALSVPALRQNYTTLLNGGIAVRLTRTTWFSSRHVVVHVTARHPQELVHAGVERNVAVRNFQSRGEQDSAAGGAQWRAAVAVEGGPILRFNDAAVNTGVSPGVSAELQRRWAQQGGVDVTGQDSALHGGTPSSERYHGDLELVVSIYPYRVGIGRDRGSRIGLGVRAKTLRYVDGTSFARSDNAVQVGGKALPRYSLRQRHPVDVLYSASAAPKEQVKLPVKVTRGPREPLARRTRTDLDTLRTFVDHSPASSGPASAEREVTEWQFVESMPGSADLLKLARETIQETQQYEGRASRRHLGGLRGETSLKEGMPLWADLTDSLTAGQQVTNLGAMTEKQWDLDPLTTDIDGGRLDVSIAGRLVNPRLVPVQAEITTEHAPSGGVQVWSSRTRETQLLARGQVGVSLRESVRPGDKYGGGGTGAAGYQRTLSYRMTRKRSKVSGAIERNVNNRKGKKRTYLVVADLRATVAAEVTNSADLPMALVPRPFQPDSWEHHKSVRHSAVIENAVYLRVSEEQAVAMGLFADVRPPVTSALAGPASSGTPVTDEARNAKLTLRPGGSPGLGLQTFHDVPSLVDPAIVALRNAVNGPNPQPLAQPILNALTGRGLADPMLNRRRMLHALSRPGVRRNWAALFDGGVSLIHADIGVFSQRLYDVRLEAVLDKGITFDQFVANHDDIDVRTVGMQGQTDLLRTAHGGGLYVNTAASAVLNPQGQQAAVGGGYQYNTNSLTSTSTTTESERRATEISSGRGVKARVTLDLQFQIRIYHRGTAVPNGTITFRAPVTVDRWAGDLRLPPPRPGAVHPPKAYRPEPTPGPEPGWQVRNGLLLPPRYAPEDLSGAAHLQMAAQALLTGAADRLHVSGYVGAHQVHQGLTPELLLPNIRQAFDPDGLELPPVPSATVSMAEAVITLGLKPTAARLGGVDSAVYREHAAQQTATISSGSNKLTQSLHAPRLLLGRGYLGDPYQALENSNSGPISGETVALAAGGEDSSASFGNVKPEGRSVLIEYVCEPTVAVTLPRVAQADRQHRDDQVQPVIVAVRMGLDDARRVLGINSGAPDDVRREFEAIVTHEQKLARLGDEFVAMGEAEAAAKYAALGSQITNPSQPGPAGSQGRPMDPALREQWQKAIGKRELAEAAWWRSMQDHYRQLDEFSARYEARPDAPVNPPLRTAPPVSVLPDNDPPPEQKRASIREPLAAESHLRRITEEAEHGEPEGRRARAAVATVVPPLSSPREWDLPVVDHDVVEQELSGRTAAERNRIRRYADALQRSSPVRLPAPTHEVLDARSRTTAALLGGAAPHALATTSAGGRSAGRHEVTPGTDLDHEYGDGQGHPTIAAGFVGPGDTEERPARVSGELGWNAVTGRWEANDTSGRYLSAKVRSDVNPGNLMRGASNVAGRMPARPGVEVTPVLLQHAEPVPAVPGPASTSGTQPAQTNMFLVADALIRPYRTLPTAPSDPELDRLWQVAIAALSGGADRAEVARRVAEVAASLGRTATPRQPHLPR
ncbi:hypothetical protein C7C45_23200 [Micromonospora arborensis]|uniref:Outer membrane channel protein CpnT-like N-terminal domain-containing protein n=1 Tax=Micromonospora arborensis TaxID=2116518 RepID=A0A318NE11_9ACTN|nr:hypothetical protein [Micromonospora arborensis]PYC66812.1 hypothetical protein C7C45_23200 [Micromonospora arborensis]